MYIIYEIYVTPPPSLSPFIYPLGRKVDVAAGDDELLHNSCMTVKGRRPERRASFLQRCRRVSVLLSFSGSHQPGAYLCMI